MKASSAFTLFELVIVIVIIGILVFSFSFNTGSDNLSLAKNQLIRDILYTNSLALKEDKYFPFPQDNSSIEQNRSKYWFKQFWQIRITRDSTGDKDYWYEVFSDQPDDTASQNFDGLASTPVDTQSISLAKSPTDDKYIIGKCGSSNYPNCNEVSTMNVMGNNIPVANLSKAYQIVLMKYKIGNGSYKTIYQANPLRIIFDNEGNVFLSEGADGDAGDINIFERTLLTQNLKIKLCQDSNCDKCKAILVTPLGDVREEKCD